jgi:hypothetical protein
VEIDGTSRRRLVLFIGEGILITRVIIMSYVVAQFGIIDEFDENKDYGYEPEKYHCVAINDDFIGDWWKELTQIKL